MRRSHFRFLFLLVPTLACSLFAEKSAPKIGFGRPEVTKLDWSTRSLVPTDLDGDGLRDIALINNDAGKVELLYQISKDEGARQQKKRVDRNRWDPVLEDALFEKRGLTIGFSVFDLVASDLNGDGLVDLAYTSTEVPLTIRYQNKDGDWVDSREFDGFEALGWTNTIIASDVNGDGVKELFVLSADATRVFTQSPDGALNEPQILYNSGENPFNMMLFDVTGDGLEDLLYLNSDGKQVLAMREQVGDLQFGPETRHVLERPARIIVPLKPVGDEAPSLGVVESRSGSLEFLRFQASEDDADETKSALEYGAPEIYPIFKKIRESASYAPGDVDGDGEEDLIIANPNEAELVLFTKKDGRFQASKAFPSFSQVSSLSVGRFYKDEPEHIIVVSEEEKTIGRSLLDAAGRLSFPRQLQIGSGDPVVTAALDLDDDGYDELLLVNESKGEYSLLVAVPSDRQDIDGGWDVLLDMELADVRRKPTAISELGVFESGKSGLMLYVPREAPVLLRPAHEDDQLGFEKLASGSSIRESLLKALEPSETSFFDVDGDGVNELVVARTGFSRAFRVRDDDLEMVDQFNARRGNDVIDAVIPVQSDGEAIDTIALYVSTEREIQILKRDSTGVFRYVESVKVGRLDLQDWFRLPASGQDKRDAFVFAGEDRFWYFKGTASRAAWEIVDVYETDLEDIHYSHLEAADFNQDGVTELIAVDGSEHVVDVLSVEDGECRSQMFWKVFEANMHYQGRTGAKLEPRQIVLDDFTGDGRLDLTLLVHDRILVYPLKCQQAD